MLYTAILLGLMGSLHCVGMCGPIAFVLPLDRSNRFKMLSQIFVYHFGRLAAYAIMGLAFGFFGKGLYVFGAQQKLSIFIGLLMILVVLIPAKMFNKYNISKPVYKIVSKIKSSLGHELQFMMLFGLGTIPLMTSAAYLGSVLKTPLKKRIQQLIPIFVVVIGVLFIVRGLGLGIPYLSPSPVSEMITGSLECHQP